MTPESFQHGATSRTPVVHGGRRVPGLHQRTLKDGSTVFEARLRVDGKDTRVVLEATTKSDAVREYQALRTDRDRGDVHENRLLNPTVGDVCDEFLERLRLRVDSQNEKLRVAPASLRQYEIQTRCHMRPVLGRKRIADVDIVDIRRLADALTAKGLAPNTASGVLATTAAVFKFALNQGYVDRNVVRDLSRDERPGSKRLTEPRYLTMEEINRLLDAADAAHRPLFACCAYAGLRNGEVRGLQWGDIDSDEDRINIHRQLDIRGNVAPTKTEGSRASVPMLPALRRELVAHRKRMAERGIALIGPDKFVFVKERGPKAHRDERYMAANVVETAIKHAADRAGLNPPGLPPLGVHDLRHSFVALALENGATLPEAAELARHSNPATTLRVYAGLTKDGRDRAARKLLDAGFGA